MGTDKARSALLLMDLQNGILERYGPGAEYLGRLDRAAQAARSAAVPVVWVTVRFRAGYPEVSANNRMFSGLPETGRLVEGEASGEIHPGLRPFPEDIRVTKRRVGAFSGSDLDVVLRAAGVDSLVLAGVATSGVVLSTLRLAADLDFRITVLRDGCLDADEEVHRVLMDKVFPRQAEVLSVEEWVAGIA